MPTPARRRLRTGIGMDRRRDTHTQDDGEETDDQPRIDNGQRTPPLLSDSAATLHAPIGGMAVGHRQKITDAEIFPQDFPQDFLGVFLVQGGLPIGVGRGASDVSSPSDAVRRRTYLCVALGVEPLAGDATRYWDSRSQALPGITRNYPESIHRRPLWTSRCDPHRSWTTFSGVSELKPEKPIPISSVPALPVPSCHCRHYR